MNALSIFDCCDACDALLTTQEAAQGERFGQTLCDPCADAYAEANPDGPIRYLLKPPTGFCAPFVIWAESPELARAYAKEWLGVTLPASTVILRFLTHDRLSCMYVGHDGHHQTQPNTNEEAAIA